MRHQLKVLFFLVFVSSGIDAAVFQANSTDALTLRLNTPLTRPYHNERQKLKISAVAGESLEIVADKKNADVGLTIFDPNGEKITTSNAPRGFANRETVFFIAAKTGTYLVEIASKSPGIFNGEFTINLIGERPANAVDEKRAAAMKSLGEAREILFGAENRLEKADQAVAKLREATEIFEKLDDQPDLATAYFQLALIIGNEYGRETEAVDIYEKALNVWRKNNDEADQAIGLTYAAHELRSKGDKRKSLAYYQEALTLNRKNNSKADEAVTLSYLSRLYNDTQKFQEGFEACRASLAITRNNDPLTDYHTYSMLGYLYYNTNDPARFASNLQISLDRILSVKDYLNPIRLAVALDALGYSQFGRKNYAAAISNLQKAIAISEQVKRPIFSAGFLVDLAVISYELKQFDKSLEYGEKAADLYTRYDLRRRSSALNIVGKSYAALGNKDRARSILLEALTYFHRENDRFAEAETLFNLAELEKTDAHPAPALDYIHSAVNLSEIIRSGLLGENSRSAYLGRLKSYYELEIEILVELDEQQPNQGFSELAWQQNEKIRARSLLENFLENGLDLDSIAPREFYSKERKLLETIAAAEQKRNQVEKSKNAVALKLAQNELHDALENYQLMQEDVRRQNPRFSSVNYLKNFTFADARSLLDPDTAFVEYALGNQQSYVWLIGKNSVKLFKIPAADAVNQAAREFYTALTQRTPNGEKLSQEKSKQLSRMILQPLAADLKNIRRLVVIADDSLQLVPFAALTVAPDDDFQPLAATMEIAGAPSVSSAVYLREKAAVRPDSPDKLLSVFADPIFQADDERLGKNRARMPSDDATKNSPKLEQTLRDFGVNRLTRLPFTGIEAKAIAAFAPRRTHLALGANASRQSFLDGGFNNYKILHFATHGFLNQENPDLSGLVLSLYDQKSQPQNGFLRAIDLYSLRLNADLVVLSACQTGLGKEVDGEGIVGLTRGFMFAGASSVVSSLWKVDDAATAELMKRFYRAMLVEDQTPAAALRTAQNELRAIPRWHSPNYWAGFVLNGEWR